VELYPARNRDAHSSRNLLSYPGYTPVRRLPQCWRCREVGAVLASAAFRSSKFSAPPDMALKRQDAVGRNMDVSPKRRMMWPGWPVGHAVIVLIAVSCGMPTLASGDLPNPQTYPREPGHGTAAGDRTAAATGDPAYALVRSQVFDIHYRVNAEAQPLSKVELWYKPGRNGPWRRYGADEDRQSPATFSAPREGLYGFFIVLTNATGSSSRPPTADTKPHHWTFVDYTPPVVQIHAPRPTTSLGRRIVRIRWTAVDANLPPRPVELAYRMLPQTDWNVLEQRKLANSGQFDWRVGDDVSGTVAIRVVVHDRAGNAAEAVCTPFNLAALDKVELDATAGLSASASISRADELPVAPGDVKLNGRKPTAEAVERADRLHAIARQHRQKGELSLAIARLRDAIELNPNKTEAIAELGALLYAIEENDRALEAYRIALNQRPTMRSALIGIAEVYVDRREYNDAISYLGEVARLNPRDVEVWMHLGDIAVYQGDEVLARQHYERAATLDPSATAIVQAARRRLDNLAALSRNYAQPADTR